MIKYREFTTCTLVLVCQTKKSFFKNNMESKRQRSQMFRVVNEKKKLSMIQAFVFLLMAIGVTFYLVILLSKYPLFDFSTQDITWVNEWLKFSVIDFEGAALCLSLIAINSEKILFFGVLWSVGFCLLGSPICFAYVIYRLTCKSLTLHDDDYHKLYNDNDIFASEDETLSFNR